jgi:GNAT superfamily N-acetyltransferase
MSAGQDKPGLEVRQAAPGDAPTVVSVLHESFVEYEPSYTPEAFAATTPTAKQIESRMSEGPVWVALAGGAIVGTVSAVPRDDALYVRGMAVLPGARGRGVGELLLRRAEDFARAAGYTRLLLSTTPFLAAAIRLYERAGFRHTGDGPHDLFGTPLLTMAKELTRPG